jgi:NAD(P)-dependent dehydrogenase (short-subunit alcohol dehydrogenase family)
MRLVGFMSKLQDRVVVITGASSGIGREAARAFAQRGAKLVLAARRTEALHETARAAGVAPDRVLIVPTDVSDEAQVSALAEAALAQFGLIDIWVNNAGVTLFSLLEDAPFDEHRRVIETNLIGSMLGARAVIPVFRRQQRGVLINIGSILSMVGQPYVPSYVISKFGLHGLTEALRTEFADDPDIHVCGLYPYTVDTQHFQAGANWIGRHARALPPLQSPEKVARALVKLAEHPVRARYVPRIAALGLLLHELAPGAVERMLLHVLRRWHFDPDAEPLKSGNLYSPDDEPARVHGERGPQTSGAKFTLWTLAELLRKRFQAPAAHGVPQGTTLEA